MVLYLCRVNALTAAHRAAGEVRVVYRRAVERFDEFLAGDSLKMDGAPNEIVEDLWRTQEPFARLAIMTSVCSNRRETEAGPVLKAIKVYTWKLKWVGRGNRRCLGRDSRDVHPDSPPVPVASMRPFQVSGSQTS